MWIKSIMCVSTVIVASFLVAAIAAVIICQGKLRAHCIHLEKKFIFKDKRIRKTTLLAGLFAISISAIHCVSIQKLDWFFAGDAVVLSTMTVMWFFSASHFYNAQEQLKASIAGMEALEDKYGEWKENRKYSRFFAVFLFFVGWNIFGVLWAWFCYDLNLVNRGTPLSEMFILLTLVLNLLMNGNSCLHMIAFTFSICDLFYEEKESATREYNRFLPTKTYSIKLMLDVAKTYSDVYLFITLCFTYFFVANTIRTNAAYWGVHGETILKSVKYQYCLFGVTVTGFVTYIMNTIGCRYYIRKITELWKRKSICAFEKALNYENHETLIPMIERISNDEVPMFPTAGEMFLIITTIIVNVVNVIAIMSH